MADSTTGALTAITGSAVDDTADDIPIWDEDASATKRITRTELLRDTPPIGVGAAAPAADAHLASTNPTLRLDDTSVAASIYGEIRSNDFGYLILEADPGAAAANTLITAATQGVVRASVGNDGLSIGTSAAGSALRLSEADDAVAVKLAAAHATYASDFIQFNATRAASSAYNFARMYSGNFADLEFQFSGDGNGTCDGAWTGGGADLAEMYEWADGNPGAEDRIGWSVTLTGDRIARAAKGDTAIGVISARPSLVMNDSPMGWQGRHLRDDWGRVVMEPYVAVHWDVVTQNHRTAKDPDTGEPVRVPAGVSVERVTHMADAIPAGVRVPADAVRSRTDATGAPLLRRKRNPDYKPDQPYQRRSERAGWGRVGIAGRVLMRAGEVTDPRWIKLRDTAPGIEEWLVR